VPTIAECEAALLSNDYNKQHVYLRYLEAMGMNADTAEKVRDVLMRLKAQTNDVGLKDEIDGTLKKIK
jgi:phosphoheptose isomerase